MSSVIFVPVAQAASFALGCYALHTAAPFAARITPYLVLVAAILASLVLAVLTVQQAGTLRPPESGTGTEYLM